MTLENTINPIGDHPALTFPWNIRRGTARRHVLAFLDLAEALGHDVDQLKALVDLRRDQLTEAQLWALR